MIVADGQKAARHTHGETVPRAYYVITESDACGLPDDHIGSKPLGNMVSALGLEPRTL